MSVLQTDETSAVFDAWLILLRAPGVGAVTLRRLLDRHGDTVVVLETLRRGGIEGVSDAARNWARQPDAGLLDADRAWLGEADHHLLTIDDPDFPPLLRDLASAPAALFVAGDPNLLWQAQVAIVGSRNASHGGLATARGFAKTLAGSGFTITSGLAEGIDAAAHEAALDAGGNTIAVLGTGPDLVYPARHRELAARIAANGALVSEFSPGTPGKAEHFPRRNRIIAGLALGTLVVEAGVRSGSLITARQALEFGREVFAIPGSIHNPLARGCHQLIRDGAHLVETADELIADLAPLAGELGTRLRERLASAPAEIASQGKSSKWAPSGSKAQRDGDYQNLLAALGHDAVGLDQLAVRTGLGVPALSSMLLVLELEGDVVATAGGSYARSSPN